MTKTANLKQIAFENYERENPIQGSSERSFGFVFVAVFIIFAGLKYRANLMDGAPWFIAAFMLLIISLVSPKILKPFNKLWTQFGLVLHRIVNPLVMSLLYYGILTPTGLLARCFKWDPLHLKISRIEKTYWIQRENQQSDLRNQF